jgi:hypothetical protein
MRREGRVAAVALLRRLSGRYARAVEPDEVEDNRVDTETVCWYDKHN